MADDPMTVTSATGINLAPGMRAVEFKLTGPADYDATNGAAFDLSSYFTTKIYSVSWGAVDAKADALVKPDYVNDDMTDLDGGAVYFTWTNAGTSAAVFGNVTDQTNLSGYVFYCTATGY